MQLLNLSSVIKDIENKQSLLTALNLLLKNNSQLQALHLANNMLNNEDIIDLTPYLINNKSLKPLSLASNKIGLKGMQIISKIPENSTLKNLDLSKPDIDKDIEIFHTDEVNYLGNNGLVTFMDVLSINDNIISLNLSDNFSLYNQGFSVIVKYLRNSSLNTLKISLQKTIIIMTMIL